jgi:hypothetical protein
MPARSSRLECYLSYCISENTSKPGSLERPFRKFNSCVRVEESTTGCRCGWRNEAKVRQSCRVRGNLRLRHCENGCIERGQRAAHPIYREESQVKFSGGFCSVIETNGRPVGTHAPESTFEADLELMFSYLPGSRESVCLRGADVEGTKERAQPSFRPRRLSAKVRMSSGLPAKLVCVELPCP